MNVLHARSNGPAIGEANICYIILHPIVFANYRFSSTTERETQFQCIVIF